jgi:hypothetical protein
MSHPREALKGRKPWAAPAAQRPRPAVTHSGATAAASSIRGRLAAGLPLPGEAKTDRTSREECGPPGPGPYAPHLLVLNRFGGAFDRSRPGCR